MYLHASGRESLCTKACMFLFACYVFCCFLPLEEFGSIWTSSLELMCHNSALLTRILHKALPVITKQSFLTSCISIESAVRIPAVSKSSLLSAEKCPSEGKYEALKLQISLRSSHLSVSFPHAGTMGLFIPCIYYISGDLNNTIQDSIL